MSDLNFETLPFRVEGKKIIFLQDDEEIESFKHLYDVIDGFVLKMRYYHKIKVPWGCAFSPIPDGPNTFWVMPNEGSAS